MATALCILAIAVLGIALWVAIDMRKVVLTPDEPYGFK